MKRASAAGARRRALRTAGQRAAAVTRSPSRRVATALEALVNVDDAEAAPRRAMTRADFV
jgi:hypothetical protein